MSTTRWFVVLGLILVMWNAVALGVGLVRDGWERVGSFPLAFLWFVPGVVSVRL
jgi:hypothetical protein